MRLMALVALVLSTSLGCQSSRDESLQIGAKPFAEQAILAEAIRHLLIEDGLDAEVVTCSNSFDCQRRLRDGDLDVMVEYSGTALQFVGGPTPDREDPISQVRRLFRPLGLTWLEPLGFDNSYSILVPVNQGATQGIESISDLAQLPTGVRVATPAEFLRRSRDGLQAMVRFYGLRLSDEPLVIADPVERFHALREGRADIAVGYGTDGSISNLGLTELSDPQHFFPPYRAAIVVRQETLEQHGQLEARLNTLAGRLPTDIMRQLNSAVQVDGDAPESVALRFLEELDLIESETPVHRAKHVPPILVSYSKQDTLGPETARAFRAVRHLFPGRPLKRLTSFRDPLVPVSSGRAHFSVVSAERFFMKHYRRPPPVEAVAVLGIRFVHLIGPAEDRDEGAPLQGRVGIQPELSSGGFIAETILSTMDENATLRGEIPVLLNKIRSGDLDAALVVTEAGATEIARPFSRGGLRISSIGSWLSPRRAVNMPYLRRARIPAGTYANQEVQIDTMSVQVVLVSPSREREAITGAAGPAAALSTPMRPLTSAQIDRLSEATGILETPDAVLPSLWTTGRDAMDHEGRNGSGLLETILNLLVIAFLAWVVFLVLRRPTPHAMSDDSSS